MAARLAILGLLLQSVAMLVPMPLWPGIGATLRQGALDEAGAPHAGEHHAKAEHHRSDGHPKKHAAAHPCQICLTLQLAGTGIAPTVVAVPAPWVVAVALAVPPERVASRRSDIVAAPPRGPPAPV